MDARDFAAIALLLGFAVFISYLRSKRLRLLRRMDRPVDRSTHEAPDEELAEIIRRKEALDELDAKHGPPSPEVIEEVDRDARAVLGPGPPETPRRRGARR